MDTLTVGDAQLGVMLAGALVEYVPQTVKVGRQTAAGTATAGDFDPGAGEPGATVCERARLVFSATTPGEALAQVDGLALLLGRAAGLGGKREGEHVWLELKREAAGTLFRSELLGGAVEEIDFEGYWAEHGQLRVTVEWERRGWWEGPERVLEAVATDTVYGAASGWLLFTDVVGDVPAPVRLEVTAQAGGPVTTVWAGLLRGTGLELFAGDGLEGEAADWGGTQQPGAADEQYAGGYFRALGWNGSADTLLCYWTVASAWLLDGSWRRLIARWAPAPAYTDLQVQARVMSGLATLWTGPWVKTDAGHELCELGSTRLPPFVASGVAGGVRFELWARRAAGGASALNLDRLALVGLDGFRRYNSLAGAGLADGQTLVDDGIEGCAYALAEGRAYGGWLAGGAGLAVHPAREHVLWLVWEGPAGVAGARQCCQVKAAYRPRYLHPR